MLIEELGYRSPSMAEILRPPPGGMGPHEPRRGEFYIPAAVLHADPLISYSGIVSGALLGAASLTAGWHAAGRGWFLLSPTWSLEHADFARMLRRRAVLHRLANPRHRIVFMCNTEAETAMMRELGEAAFDHNKTANTCERTFRPLDGAEPEFDAIYNAQLAPWKRHELALAIPRCAFVFYRGGDSTAESEAALIADHRETAPEHVFINEFDGDGTPVRLPAEEVNRQLNRAAVGLCLSEEEGAMFACAEYLLAGLPVVTTPNRGGRNFFIDGETCVLAAADPGSIAQAVAELKAKALPRAYVREKALQRIGPERDRFIGLVNAILSESGAPGAFESPWPLKRPVIMEWIKPKHARRRALRGVVDDLRAG